MDKIIEIHHQYKKELLKKPDFNEWVISKEEFLAVEEVLKIALTLPKTTILDQNKQTKYYEALRWSILSLCRYYITQTNYKSYFDLIRNVIKIKNTNMTFLVKLVAKLITYIEEIKELGKDLSLLIKEIIKICEELNNVSMKNKMNIKLSELCLINEDYKTGLEIIGTTLIDLKRYEDNLGLIEIQLIESKIHHRAKGIVKAKAALTTVKTLCTKVFIEPKLQAKIDMHSGMISAHEKDFNLAYSYFYEAFDVYNLPQVKKPEIALKALEYMVLSKIMGGKLDEINNIIYGKNQSKYFGKEVELLKEVEKSVRAKNTKMLGDIVNNNKEYLLNDFFLKFHLKNLHDELLEKNIKKIIEPYSVVEINFITKTIGIESNEILNKLSQMILDKKINGILDQGRGSLIIYEESLTNEYLEKSLVAYKKMDGVVDSLFNKAKSSNI